jgi:hypothetical protein
MRNIIIKKIIISSVLVLFFFSGNAQKITMNQGNTAQKNYYTEIPFEYVNSKIIIPVVIQNKTYRFLLDTGAPNCITQRLKKELNTTLIKQLPVTDANDNKSIMDIIALPELSIGGITFQNTMALAYKEQKNLVFDCFEIDGFIGSNLLRNSILQIDIKNKLIRITNDLKKVAINKNDVAKVSLLGNQSSPFIWIKINGRKAAKEQVLLDTGMKGFYDLSNRAYNIFKNKTEIKVLSTGNGSNSLSLFENTKSSDQLRLLVPEITISKTKFTAITTTTTDDKNSRIGIDLLEYGIGTLDYQNKKFYFSAYSDTNNLSEVLQPFSPTILNNKLSVGIVWDEKLKDEITTGDEILEMNDINYEQYAICDLIAKPSIFKDIIIKELVVKKSDGTIRKVSL